MRFVNCVPCDGSPATGNEGYCVLCDRCFKKRCASGNRDCPATDEVRLDLSAPERLADVLPDEVGFASCADCDAVEDSKPAAERPATPDNEPPVGSWASVARAMASGDDSGFDWDAWKDERKERE